MNVTSIAVTVTLLVIRYDHQKKIMSCANFMFTDKRQFFFSNDKKYENNATIAFTSLH